ncbi:MAG: AzlC family ABC transporter permease [Bowdeniella nasicola]|nr:AzlC family ABC transporter permease [Bowdeniella nasicola]
MKETRRVEALTGLRGGLPIGLGYFAVSLAVGLYWAQGGFPPLSSALFSATNMSSTGQFAAMNIMAVRGGVVELAATTALVNLRYFLMSISLSQRLDSSVGTPARLLIAAGVTDEVYALNISRWRVSTAHYLASMILPILGWTAGTLTGALVGQVIPPSVQAAAGILLYAMFVAIVVPPARGSRDVSIVVALAALASIALWVAPVVRDLQVGWRIIIATLVAAGIGATLFPVGPQEDEEARARVLDELGGARDEDAPEIGEERP